MKIVEKKCPNCGGNLDFKVGERDVKCESCRRKFAIEYDGVDFSQLTEQATEALRAADISLRPVRRLFLAIVLVFFGLVAAAGVISTIAIVNSRKKFDDYAKQSQEDFERRSQEMLDSVKR